MRGRFTTGSTARHVVVMALTGSLGLITVFLVDFIDIYFIAQLNDTNKTAAVGFALNLMFFVRAAGLALSIAAGILVARNLGAGQERRARRLGCHATLLAVGLVSLLSLATYLLRRTLLQMLGASGVSLSAASDFLNYVLLTAPFLTAGFCGGQLLRALGQGAQSMTVSISVALINGLLDPLLIFQMNMGIDGAALATATAQVCMCLLAWGKLWRRFNFVNFRQLHQFAADIGPIFANGLPVLLTNMATPLVLAFTSRAMASFGNEAMSAYVVIMRFFPLVSAMILALSGAVAPIVGQNAGAGYYDRVRATLYHALWFNWLLVLLISGALWLGREHLLQLFELRGLGAELFLFFTSGLTLFIGFDGMMFYTISSFNNLGRPFFGTVANFCRVLFGSIPLILLGKYLYGAHGVLLGFMMQNVLVATVSFILLLLLVERQRQQKNIHV